MDRDKPAKLRAAAADALSRAKLADTQLKELAAKLPKAGALELDRLLDAFVQTTDEAVGRSLLAALNDAEVRPSLRADAATQRLARYSPAVRKGADELAARLDAAVAAERGKLDGLLKSLPAGDVRRGQVVFNAAKTSCIACHAIGYVGGKVGPDLTRIGAIRTERDLLEAVVVPSASFVRSYEPVRIALKGGRTLDGIVKRETPDEVVLTVAADKDERVARADIDEVRPGKVSVMPAGLDKQLTAQELADLIAFLKACR